MRIPRSLHALPAARSPGVASTPARIACAWPCTQVIMNPLHASTARITSREFDRRVRLAAKRIVP